MYNYSDRNDRMEYITDIAHMIERFINILFYKVFPLCRGHIDIWNKLGDYLVPIHFRRDNDGLMNQRGYVKCTLNVKIRYIK